MRQTAFRTNADRIVRLLAFAILCGAGCDMSAKDPTVQVVDDRHIPTSNEVTTDQKNTINSTANCRESEAFPLTSASQLSESVDERVRIIGRPSNNKYDGFGIHSDWMERGRILPMEGKEPWSAEATEGVIEITGVLRRTPPYTINESQRRDQVQYNRGPGQYSGDFYIGDYVWNWLVPPGPVNAPKPW